MTPFFQALYGLLMITIGGLKAWLHMGATSVLVLPTCSGKPLYIAMQSSGWLEQVHCWGCYLFAAGVAMTVLAIHGDMQKRRSVAYGMD